VASLNLIRHSVGSQWSCLRSSVDNIGTLYEILRVMLVGIDGVASRRDRGSAEKFGRDFGAVGKDEESADGERRGHEVLAG